jgi:hypothetical protein
MLPRLFDDAGLSEIKCVPRVIRTNLQFFHRIIDGHFGNPEIAIQFSKGEPGYLAARLGRSGCRRLFQLRRHRYHGIWQEGVERIIRRWRISPEPVIGPRFTRTRWTIRPTKRHRGRRMLQIQHDGQIASVYRNRVKPRKRKYSALQNRQIRRIIRPASATKRDVRAIVTQRGAGCDGPLRRRVPCALDENAAADGEIVWSWRRDPGATLAEVLFRWQRGQERPLPGESTYKPQNHCAGKAGMSRLYL